MGEIAVLGVGLRRRFDDDVDYVEGRAAFVSAF